MKVKPITNPDTTCEDPAYWDRVLKSHRLGMDRGKKSANTCFLGDQEALESLANDEDLSTRGLKSVRSGGYRASPAKRDSF